ncbi:IS110 family transposase [Rhodoflexus sp.]
MENYSFFIGIDVSKASLDLTLRNAGQVLAYQKIANEREGIEQLLQHWQQAYSFSFSRCLICLENTGRYMHTLLHTLSLQQACIWIENATVIKRSLGLQRGKNDKADAHRIAEYAYRYQDKVVLYQPAPESLQKLQSLQASRTQLVATRVRLQTDLQESRTCEAASLYQLKEQHYQPVIAALNEQIKALDRQMDELIANDNSLSALHRIVCSVPGVGKITSIALLVATQGFTKFSSAKKLACYCGIVPFEHSSGSSVRGKTRLSHFANKSLKSLLHLCAMTAIQREGELKIFYQRKVAQGKQKMSALNAVKNKIIQRIMALVRDGRTYEKNYILTLA